MFNTLAQETAQNSPIVLTETERKYMPRFQELYARLDAAQEAVLQILNEEEGLTTAAEEEGCNTAFVADRAYSGRVDYI